MRRSGSVRVEYDGRAHTGPVVDLRDTGLSPGVVGQAIRADGVDQLQVTSPPPHAVHDHVGVLTRDVSVAVTAALAAAARSRGFTAPQDDDIEAVREQLADLTVPAVDPDPAAARRRLAGTETAVERRRERVATIRGRLQGAREAGRETAPIEAELADATRALSEAETERAAAREALDRAERDARAGRDARERRRQFQDRIGNLERAARAHLVDHVRDEYERAVADLGCDSAPCAVEDDVAALAVARVADLRAPVVLATDRLAPQAAADWLETAVVRVRG